MLMTDCSGFASCRNHSSLTLGVPHTENSLNNATQISLSLVTPTHPKQSQDRSALSPHAPQALFDVFLRLRHHLLRRPHAMLPMPRIASHLPFVPLMCKHSASDVDSRATRHQLAMQPSQAVQNRQYWSNGAEVDSSTAMRSTSVSSIMSTGPVKESAQDFTESTLARFVEMHTTERVHAPRTDLDQVLYIIVSPYVPSSVTCSSHLVIPSKPEQPGHLS